MSDLVAGPSGVARSWGPDPAPRMPPSIEALRKAAIAPAVSAKPVLTLNDVQGELAANARLLVEHLQVLAGATQQLDGRPVDPVPDRVDSPGGLTQRLAAEAAHHVALRDYLAGLTARIVAANGG